ncbi:hypothetical protein [Brevundimonas sp.]|uniref:hypothetical protein n=1 Tax=Brevundimonas sp. TaxID=1871086 RepID=UPI003D6CFC6C
MAQIEVEAADAEVIARLGQLLERSAHTEFSTTCALGFSTTIFAWIAQRVRREGEPLADTLKAKWQAVKAQEEPWQMPAPLGDLSVFDAVVRLRRASTHADGSRTHPQNAHGSLVGFVFDAHQVPFVVLEADLRRFAVLVAREFSDHMRPVDANK